MRSRFLASLFLCTALLFGQTYPSANPPDYTPPPLPTTRSGEIKDPQTGRIFKRMTLPGDVGNATFWGAGGPTWYDAGNHQSCSEWTLADGGYLCAVPTVGGGPRALYWLHKD